jgi:hypothetical protein
VRRGPFIIKRPDIPYGMKFDETQPALSQEELDTWESDGYSSSARDATLQRDDYGHDVSVQRPIKSRSRRRTSK